MPVFIEVKTAQQVTDFTSGIKLLWNTVRTPQQSKFHSPSSMLPSNFRCPNLHVTISQNRPTIMFQSLLHGSANQRRFGPSTSDWTAKAIIFININIYIYISKALVSKLFYEDIKPEHCTEEPLSSFISNHIYYIQLTCSIMFFSKLDAANAQWPEF